MPTFESIRHGSRFEMVTRNAKLLNDYAKEVGKHRTRMWSVIQETNYHELDDLVRLAAELGFGRLKCGYYKSAQHDKKEHIPEGSSAIYGHGLPRCLLLGSAYLVASKCLTSRISVVRWNNGKNQV